MGCSTSFYVPAHSKTESTRKTHWQRLVHFEDAKASYILDRSINEDSMHSELELRALLDSSIARDHMKAYCHENEDVGSYNLLVCWQVLQKLQTRGEYTLEQVYTICGTLFECTEGVQQERFGVIRARISYLFQASKSQWMTELPLLFIKLRRSCFECIFLMYETFVRSSSFAVMCTALRTEFNNVTPKDFVYLSKLGSGTYGLVLHCIKRSTGMHCAMKIQPKALLLRHFKSSPANVVVEMRANACCRHHYLTELYYAFQTPTLAIMVMNVCACGDLNQSLKNCYNRQMPLVRVRFYAAEIISALQYLHANDLIYRDLKPANVLLNADGHIKLTDFGSLADLEGSLDADKTYNQQAQGDETKRPTVPVFESMYALPGRILSAVTNSGGSRKSSLKDKDSPLQSPDVSGDSGDLHSIKSISIIVKEKEKDKEKEKEKEKQKGKEEEKETVKEKEKESVKVTEKDTSKVTEKDTSKVTEKDTTVDMPPPMTLQKKKTTVRNVVGTLEYMAPEIMALLAASSPVRGGDDGYAEAVDWWSLGCLVYKLLFGRLPFRSVSVNDVRKDFPACIRNDGSICPTSFELMFGPLAMNPGTDPDAVNFINELICLDPLQRLGHRDSKKMNKFNLIRAHPFLKSIDWDLLEKKQLPPPYIPVSEVKVPNVDFKLNNAMASRSSAAGLVDSLQSSVHGHGHGHGDDPSSYECHSFESMLSMCGKTDWVGGEETLAELFTKAVKKKPSKRMFKVSPRGKVSQVGGKDPLDERNFSGSGGSSAASASAATAAAAAAAFGRTAKDLKVPDAMQEHFSSWKYVSPSMIDTEEIQYGKSKPKSAGGRFLRTVLGTEGEDFR